MRSVVERCSTEPFRPFFWVDDAFRVRGWPEATARALRVPARAAVGRSCRAVLGGIGTGAAAERCARCPAACAARTADVAHAPDDPLHTHCTILPLPEPGGGAIVWLPLSHIVAGGAASAQLERAVARGVLAERLGSVAGTLEGLRRVVAADDCELFLVDPSGKEVVLVDCEGPDRAAFMERTHMPLGAGYPGTVTLLQQPLFTNEFQRDRRFLRQAVKRRGIRSFIGVPLGADGRPLGYVGVGWRDDAVPMEWGLRLLEEVKSLVPIALPGRHAGARAETRQEGELAVRCFGPFELVRDGQRIRLESFGRRKAVQLLKCLLLQRGTPVHRDRLVELLWPDAPPRAGANRLHGVVSALRSTIERGRGPRTSAYVLCDEDRYRFNTEAPHAVDLFDFLDRVDAARGARRGGDDERALGLLEDALRLYRGDLFAEDAEEDPFEPQRVRLRHTYLDAARMRAELCVRSGRPDEAIWTLRAALDVEPAALDLYESLITLLARAGRVGEARQQYECCRAALRRYLDMEPPARTRALEKLLF
ncbi:MAG: BTAD domain-containing putative transcriptional regulator [Burkholderiales bacterium]